MPPLFQAVKTTKSTLDSTAIVNGKVYFAQDSEQLFFDYDNARTEIRDIIILETEAARTDTLAPKNKFYFVMETAALWLYKDGDWIQASGGSGGGITLASQSFEAGTDLASVTLDTEVLSDSSIVAVIVDNTTLLKSTYSLGTDYKTITFSEAITCELGIDVIYSVSSGSSSTSAAAVSTLSTTKSRSVTSTTDTELTLTIGNVYSLSLTGNTTISFGTWTEGYEESVTLYLTVPDNYTLTLPADIKWKDGAAPSLEVDGVYILEFKSIDGGTTVYGSISKYI